MNESAPKSQVLFDDGKNIFQEKYIEQDSLPRAGISPENKHSSS